MTRIVMFRLVFAALAVVLAITAVLRLEGARNGLSIESVILGETPTTLFRGPDAAEPLVIVSHGFAGSRQMMHPVSIALAQAGATVVVFDYHGHGRHIRPMSPEIEVLTGATEDLIQQTVRVVEEAQALTGLGTTALIGHSMATDIIVRSAQRLTDINSIIAISMYSEAVTEVHPKKLLIISGENEGRLREIAIKAVAQVSPGVEGETVAAGDVSRRAVYAPSAGHVGVLWSDITSTEIGAWLGVEVTPQPIGLWLKVLLGSIIALFWPIASLLPQRSMADGPSLKQAIIASSAAAFAGALAALTGLSLIGLSGFGGLTLALAISGGTMLIVLKIKPQISLSDALPAALLIVWGLGAFAIALDRYGAAFLPTGPRAPLMALILPITIVFCFADRAMMQGRGVMLRALLRVPFIAFLLGAMILRPEAIGLLLTVIPVLALFFAVYGTMALWVQQRSGPMGAGIGAGVSLAWSIAASTPLFGTG